jgi:hypothetical protein
MLMVRTRHGVCSACIHELVCAHPRDLERPPLQCAEFEIGYRPSDKLEVAGPDGAADAPLNSPARPGSLKGLCVNCDERETCSYPKPEGGVWRCEEYR